MPRRVVLSEEITDMRALQAWMFRAGPNLLREIVPDAAKGQPYEVVWRHRGATVHFIDDTIAKENYFAFTAHFPELEARLHADFETFDPAALIAASAPSPAERGRQAVRVGLIADCEERRDAAFDLLRERLADASAEVRLAALLGVSYTSARAWAPQVATLAAEDPDAGVREEAARVVEALRAHGS
ncbi:MAG: hypothetical protein R3A79_08060 [Nannocystaceae bacterium]